MTAHAPENPHAASDAQETIFLSPRVLDEAAFEQFSATLRGLVERADQQRTMLAEMVKGTESAKPQLERLAESQRLAIKAAGDVARQREEVRDLLASIDRRTEAAREVEARMAEQTRALDERMTRAESVLERASDLLGRIESIQAQTHAISTAADRAQEARRALEASSARADQITQRVRHALDEFSRCAEELAQPLARERSAGEQTVNELRAAADDCRSLIGQGTKSARSLENALDELESWRGVLLDADHDPRLPPSLQRLVDDLRAGVLRDLSEMAQAMRRLVERAPSIERKPEEAARASIVTRPLAPSPLVVADRADDGMASGAD